jgi:hypothetical protein
MASPHSYASAADRPSFSRLAVLGRTAFARQLRSARRLQLAIVCVALACLAVPFAAGLQPGTRGVPAAVRQLERLRRAYAATTLLRLSATARGEISAALGAEESAYRVSGLRAWKGKKLTILGRKHFGDSIALSSDGSTAFVSGYEGGSGVWEFKNVNGWTNEGPVMPGSAALAVSRDANTLLAGGDLNNGKAGIAQVLIRQSEEEGGHPLARETRSSVPPRHFALGNEKVRKDGAIELAVELPGAGVLEVSQLPVLATAARVKPRASTHKRSKRAGSKKRAGNAPILLQAIAPQTIEADVIETTLVLKPTATALRELARKRSVTVPVQVSFTPTGGSASLASTTISFAQPGFTFESGIEGWTQAWGGLTVAPNTAHPHTGSHSLRIDVQSDPYSAVNVTEQAGIRTGSPLTLLAPGVPVSMWVYRPAGTPLVGFRAMVRVGSEWTECRSAEVRPRANRWVRLSIAIPGSVHCRGPAEPTVAVHAVGIEIDDKGNRAAGKSVYLDDVSW